VSERIGIAGGGAIASGIACVAAEHGQVVLWARRPDAATAKVEKLIDKRGGDIWLQVDGGVSLETIERCAEAGADVFVAGSAVYSAADPDRMVADLRAAAEAATSR